MSISSRMDDRLGGSLSGKLVRCFKKNGLGLVFDYENEKGILKDKNDVKGMEEVKNWLIKNKMWEK